MKNFKKVVFGLLAMLVMVTGVNAASYNKVVVANEDDLIACLGTTDYDTVDCTINGNVALTKADITVSKTATLNITNGAKLTITGHKIDVDGSLTINGGKISSANGSYVFAVNAGAELIVKGTEINTTGAGVVFQVTGAAKATGIDDQAYTTLNVDATINAAGTVASIGGVYTNADLAGTWTITGSHNAVYTNGTNAVINVNGDFTSKNDRVFTLDGVGILNINGGSYAGATEVVSASGTAEVTVKGADTELTAGSSDAVKATDTAVVILEDGTYTSKTGSHAVALTTVSKILDGYYVAAEGKNDPAYVYGGTIYGGEFQFETEDLAVAYAKNPYNLRAAEGLSAVAIGNVVYIGTTYKLTINVTEENGEAIEYVSPVELLAGHEYSLEDLVTVEAAEGYAAKYVLNGTEIEGTLVMPEKDSELEVSFVVPSEDKPAADKPAVVEPEKNPENNGEANTTDEKTNTNPSTFDGIASIVTMAISSVSAAGYSIKKIVRR